jgi:hypothetical protein
LDIPMTAEFESSRRMPRWRPDVSTLALLCSISLNIGFASYLAIQALPALWQPRTYSSPDEATAVPDKMIASLATRLPGRDADILWDVYRTKKPQIQAMEAVAQGVRVRLFSVLAERDLDTGALRAVIKDAMDSRLRMGELQVETLVDALGRISPDGRQQLARQYRPK